MGIERRTAARGELARILYRLGRQSATGVLTIAAKLSRNEVFVLRRGAAVVAGTSELDRKTLVGRLVRLVAQDVVVTFEGGVSGLAPLGATQQIDLAGWARTHLENQLDGSLAEALARELAGARIALRPELAPIPQDDADRRMLAAMAQPRRLDQIWPLARTPRFRLLAFVHFLRAVDAVETQGVVEPVRPVLDPQRSAALALLGIDHTADADAVKRAYRRLARALHPDLQPEADELRRRVLERRFAEVTAAYEALS